MNNDIICVPFGAAERRRGRGKTHKELYITCRRSTETVLGQYQAANGLHTHTCTFAVCIRVEVVCRLIFSQINCDKVSCRRKDDDKWTCKLYDIRRAWPKC